MNDQLNTGQGGIDQGGIGGDAPAPDLIEVRVPARVEMIATVRTVASEVASRADFDLDTVADVRMAVDEACNQVASHADPDRQMQVMFEVRPDGYLRVTIRARTRPDSGGLDSSGFGWQVLRALTDELAAESGAGPDGDEIIVTLAKKEPEA